MKPTLRRGALSLTGCLVTVLALLAGCQKPEATRPPAADNPADPLDAMFAPPAPPTVARNDGSAAAGPEGAPPPAPPALNAQAVDKIIEDNITMREEIRRLRIERENLIRLLRAMGETYDPIDPDKKAP